MKHFIEGMLDGFASFGLVAGGAIGGMALARGFYVQSKLEMFVGGLCIIVNMVASLIAYISNKEK